ncbi:NADH-quinone oxidoreductase subunit N [Candidatus Hakubella thermalkaliphila]|uniref:NADH-quinone oxidoreductase subunit N n=2 Tax=Candidatus Hakubella thermalkaliphila TaxID=2754717 RepID=A0A6V8PRA5_9ACTN|nr:NADH-quinone oxidoreductase subunit N [Candidatus Hakubella thermalkaliphila]GFP34723.1 NADH-quinone oxidoreductase subunit N [Candidatus Hakubella thermalkaliphila]
MNLNLLLPEIIVFSFSLIVLFVSLFWNNRKPSLTLGLMSIAGLLLAIGAFVVIPRVGATAFGGMFVADGFSLFFRVLFLNLAAMIVLLAIDFMREFSRHLGEFYFLLLIVALGAMLMSSANDLIMIFLALELLSLPSYILVGFAKRDPRSNEAALKYFLLGVLASAMLLYGMSLIFGLTGSTGLVDIASKFEASGGSAGPALLVAIIMIIAGFGFKIAAVPFHFWSPDTYEGAPTSVTVLLATLSMIGGFVGLYRLFFIALPDYLDIWTKVIFILAFLSMTMGSLIAMSQDNLKRLLAYSGIAHGGYILIAFSVATFDSQWSVLVYFLAYIFMTVGAFAVAMVVERARGSSEISALGGLGYSNPFLGVTMTIFMMSLVGLPPFAGFIGKLYVFKSAVEGGALFLVLVAIVTSVISLYFYLKVVRQIYFVKGDGEAVQTPNLSFAVIALCAIYTILICLYPEFFTRIALAAIS